MIHSCSYYCERPECIKAQRDELRDRLAQPEQEPVVWECKAGGLKRLSQRLYEKQPDNIKRHYTRIEPPQRKPLKLREIEKCIYDANNDPIVACRNVEAAHGIKENT